MNRRVGFSLLEVVLSLGILATSVAAIGELVRIGSRNAQLARDLSQAQLLCDAKLAEIHAGIVQAQNTTRAIYPNQTGWLYSIEVQGGGSNAASLLKVRVTVEQDPQTQRRPAKVAFTRWILDPVSQATPQLSSNTTSTSGSTGSGNSTGASGASR